MADKNKLIIKKWQTEKIKIIYKGKLNKINLMKHKKAVFFIGNYFYMKVHSCKN